MNWGLFVGLFCAISVASFVLTKAAIAPLRRRALLDHPNERSSHTAPTPRGGGIAVICVLLLALSLSGYLGLTPLLLSLKLAGIAFFLACVSWLDDLRDLGALVRFGSHIIAVACALAVELVSGPFLGSLLPAPIELVLIGLGWVWFINLFNFMDGIDGIAGVEALSIGLGGMALALYTDSHMTPALIGLMIAAAAIGFLPSNWAPAKIFMGDVGSIPLGFLCAWILLSLASQGMGAAAFILSMVFFADATLTLLKRLLRGEKIWQAHRQHFYQQAVQRGLSHSQTTRGAIVANSALIGLALWSTNDQELPAIIASFVVIGALFLYYLKYPLTPSVGGAGS